MNEPDDDGTTAFGLFGLADDCLNAARTVSPVLRSSGPIRLLCLHACELFLKTYLRKTGSTHPEMRALGHDLARHADLAIERGLALSNARRNDLRAATESHTYVDVRYSAGSLGGPFSSASAVIDLAIAVREAVRSSLDLNEFGMPNSP